MTDLSYTQSAVMDMLDIIKNGGACEMPVDMSRADFNNYSDHRDIRPYTDVVGGVNWYLNQEGTEHIPDEIVLRIVAFNFGISLEEATNQIENQTLKGEGFVDLT